MRSRKKAAQFFAGAMTPDRPVPDFSIFCASTRGCPVGSSVFKNLCDFIVREKSTFSTIYVGGYYMRLVLFTAWSSLAHAAVMGFQRMRGMIAYGEGTLELVDRAP